MLIEKKMHDEACQLLEEVGVKCETGNRKVIDTLEATGCAAFDPTTKRIHILRSLVDEALKTTPKRGEFTKYVPERSFGSGGTAPYVYDETIGDWIPPDVQIHVAEVAKTAEKYKLPFIFRGTGKAHCEYEDVEQIKVLRKHYNGFLYLYVATEAGVMAVKREYDKNPMCCSLHSIFYSPLALNDAGPNMPIYFRCIEENLPIYLVTMPILRVNAPATIYGLAMQCHAEFLAGLCLTQTLRPGIMTIHAGYPLASNLLDDYNINFGSVAHNFVNLSVAKVASYLNLPSIQSGFTTNNHHPEKTTERDVIRAYMLWNNSDDWHQARHAFGFVQYQLAFSIPKMERDILALNQVLKENKKIELPVLEYDPGAIGVIADCAPVGNYINHDHTLKNIKSFNEDAWHKYLD